MVYGSSLTLLTAASKYAGSPTLCLEKPIVGKAQRTGDRVYTHTSIRQAVDPPPRSPRCYHTYFIFSIWEFPGLLHCTKGYHNTVVENLHVGVYS
jgi:hypothetical protein